MLQTMTRLVGVVLAMVVAFVGSCSSKSPPPPVQLERFVVKDYNWEIDGYDVLVVNADGSVTFVGALPEREQRDGRDVVVPVWHRVDGKVEPATVDALASHLAKARFQSLASEYVDPEIEDGENIEYVLATRDGVKRVRFRNRYPDEVKDLRTFVQTELVHPQRAALATARRLTYEEAEQFWSGL